MQSFKQHFYEASMSNWKSLVSQNDELRNAIELIDQIENVTGKETLLVGGCVRDLLMGIQPHDVDIATAAPITDIKKHFKTHDIGQSKDFGIVVVRHGGYDYEIANFREDIFDDSADGRHPTGTNIAKSFKDDSARRDFSVNALGINKDGEIVDHQDGLKDLNKKILRAVGDPAQRFKEDGLRIMRLLRFAVKLGFSIEDKTLKAAKELNHLVGGLSKERIREEIYKVAGISGKALADYLIKLDEVGLLESVLPEFYALKGMPQDPQHHPEGDVDLHLLACLRQSRSKDPVTNLAILSHDLGKATTYNARQENNGRVRIHTYDGHDKEGLKIIEDMGKRLKMSNDDIEAIKFATSKHMVMHNAANLSKSKLATIVNDKNWPVLKEVVYADQMSSGNMNAEEVAKNLDDIEASVKQGLGDESEIKSKVKNIVDGNKILQWMPDLNKRELRPLIGKIMQQLNSYIIDNNLFDISEDEIKRIALEIRVNNPIGENIMNKFEQVCESFGIIKTVKREIYPREIRLSEEFLSALKKEFYHHKLEEDTTKPVKNYPEKFAKALRFQISHLNDSADVELAAMRQKFEEDKRVPEVEIEGEEEKCLVQNDAPENKLPSADDKKQCKGKRIVLQRNIQALAAEAASPDQEEGYKVKSRDTKISSSMPRKSKHGDKVARWATHGEMKDPKTRSKWVNKRKTI